MKKFLLFALATTMIFDMMSSLAFADATSAPPPENLVIIDPYEPGNYSIVYEQGVGRNFTFKVSLLLNGFMFGKYTPVEKIFVNIYDPFAQVYVAEWTPIYEQTPAAVLPQEFRLQFTLDKFSAPSYLILRQSQLYLNFAVNAPDSSVLPIRFLDLGKYCGIPQIRPGIIDRTNGNTGCP